jgi:hypothetical protein
LHFGTGKTRSHGTGNGFLGILAPFAALAIQSIDAPAHQKSFWLCRLIVYYGAQPANFAVEH